MRAGMNLPYPAPSTQHPQSNLPASLSQRFAPLQIEGAALDIPHRLAPGGLLDDVGQRRLVEPVALCITQLAAQLE